MDIRKLDRDGLARAYGLDYQLLLPWPTLNAPFEGAWCVLHPGDVTDPHAHHEGEIFIGMSGSAALVADGERAPFVLGDIAHLRPGVLHQVVNDGDRDFEYYAIWWDTEMAARFTARHQETG